MKFIADLHIHSHYSIATSKLLIPEYLYYWARLKGITVVGTGDFSHPGWVKELKEKLEPAEEGLFKLKNEFKQDTTLHTPFLPHREVRFMLTAEISSIYKKKDKVRKVHNVIFAPDFETVEKIQQKLTGIGGNITSDGRPILGLDSKDLLELALDCSEQVFFVPAHIWTPWFSVLGDKSGFESIEECFDDLSTHIYAVETGLSSDPPMNWMCSFLDNYTLLSNSDAHSPQKLGRNANRFDTELSYNAITGALKNADPQQCLGTIDLFPQEGKYHYDGHRKCGVCWDPVNTLKHQGVCPECGKPVTVGVMNRVARISDREDLSQRKNRLPFSSIIPLKEILSELMEVSPNSRKVDREYFSILKKGRPELEILLDMPVAEIAAMGNEEVAESVRRMRSREVFVKEGFDGEYGVIKVFREGETHIFSNQKALFTGNENEPAVHLESRKTINFDLHEYRELAREQTLPEEETARGDGPKGLPEKFLPRFFQKAPLRGGTLREDDSRVSINSHEYNYIVGDKRVGAPRPRRRQKSLADLNAEQQKAAAHPEGPALIIAGPGTGKTRVLAERVVYLVLEKGIAPEHILAVTFTNRAAAEMRERVESMLQEEKPGAAITIATFHALGLAILKELSEPVGLPPAGPPCGQGIKTRGSFKKPPLDPTKLLFTPHFRVEHVLSEETGRGKNFSLIDEEDRKLLLGRIPGCEKRKVSAFSDAVSKAKQEIESFKRARARSRWGTPNDHRKVEESLQENKVSTNNNIDDPEFTKIFEHYERQLREMNCFDLDDLIYVPVKLLSLYPELAEYYRNKYRWIMVDEYQDINYAQYRMISSFVLGQSSIDHMPPGPPRGQGIKTRGAFLKNRPPPPPKKLLIKEVPAADNQANLCVIGDPDQAIYGFRGADVTFIKKFMDDFPDAALYRLKKSYRCSDSILRASRDVMKKNDFAGEALRGMGKGVKIKISKNPTHKSEAEFIARTIENMMGGLRFFSMDSSITQGNKAGKIESLSDFAVLCRTKGQFEAIEKAFRDHAIPYRTIGEQPFFKQEPVNTIIDMLRLLQNPSNNFLKEKLLASGTPPPFCKKVGPKTFPEGPSGHLDDLPNHNKFFGGPGGDFSKKPPGRRRQDHIKDIIVHIIDNYFAAEKQENELVIMQLMELAGNFGKDLDGFLNFTTLGTGMDTYQPGLENVTLMTLHAAKGLEFKCVFITGCEEGLLPYSLYESQTSDTDEERRLLYVGMTRAKEFLFLCHAEKRFLRGREFRLKRSTFLEPIEKELIEQSHMQQRKQKEKEVVQRSLFSDDEL